MTNLTSFPILSWFSSDTVPSALTRCLTGSRVSQGYLSPAAISKTTLVLPCLFDEHLLHFTTIQGMHVHTFHVFWCGCGVCTQVFTACVHLRKCVQSPEEEADVRSVTPLLTPLRQDQKVLAILLSLPFPHQQGPYCYVHRHTQLFAWNLGSQLRSSCLSSKHSYPWIHPCSPCF